MTIETERVAREAAEQRAVAAERASALSDAIAARGLVGERAQLAQRLTDPAAEDLPAAVEATLKQYPAMFADPAPPPGPKMIRRPGPTTPPASTNYHRQLPGGYLSPGEYMDSPRHVRYSDEFRKRVEVSRKHWPKFLRGRDLPQEE